MRQCENTGCDAPGTYRKALDCRLCDECYADYMHYGAMVSPSTVSIPKAEDMGDGMDC